MRCGYRGRLTASAGGVKLRSSRGTAAPSFASPRAFGRMFRSWVRLYRVRASTPVEAIAERATGMSRIVLEARRMQSGRITGPDLAAALDAPERSAGASESHLDRDRRPLLESVKLALHETVSHARTDNTTARKVASRRAPSHPGGVFAAVDRPGAGFWLDPPDACPRARTNPDTRRLSINHRRERQTTSGMGPVATLKTGPLVSLIDTRFEPCREV
jgi:hypothetical protein